MYKVGLWEYEASEKLELPGVTGCLLLSLVHARWSFGLNNGTLMYVLVEASESTMSDTGFWAMLQQNACTIAIFGFAGISGLEQGLYSANEPTRTCLVSKCQELGLSLTVVTNLIYSLLLTRRL